MQIIASGRAARATSGMISGLGLASARISGFAAMSGEQLGLQHAGRRQAEKDVGAVDHVGQRARLGVLDVGVLPAVHLVDAALVGDAEAVGDPDVLDAWRRATPAG